MQTDSERLAGDLRIAMCDGNRVLLMKADQHLGIIALEVDNAVVPGQRQPNTS